MSPECCPSEVWGTKHRWPFSHEDHKQHISIFHWISSSCSFMCIICCVKRHKENDYRALVISLLSGIQLFSTQAEAILYSSPKGSGLLVAPWCICKKDTPVSCPHAHSIFESSDERLALQSVDRAQTEQWYCVVFASFWSQFGFGGPHVPFDFQ